MSLPAAIELAATSPNAKWRLGCILVAPSGAVIGQGTNSVSYGVDVAPFSCHAEESALESVEGPIPPGTVAYVARWKRSGVLGIARPCANCASQLRHAGIKIVHWTGFEGEPCVGSL